MDIPRDNWERIAVDEACNREHVYLGATSRYIHRHLTRDWKARADKVLPFTNGVSFPYLERFERRSRSFLVPRLRKAGIPLDAPLFLSFARAHWYKGLDLAAGLGVELSHNYSVHPVILALDDATGEAAGTIARIKEVLEAGGGPYTLLTDYPTLLPRWLMQWHRCAAVAVMSRREPFGLIPSEYRLLGPIEGLLITSDAGGLPEQTLHDNEGIVLPVADLDGLSMLSEQAVLEAWPEAGNLKSNKAGRLRVELTYNMEKNLLTGLERLLSS